MIASINVAKRADYLIKDYYHKDVHSPLKWLGSGAKSYGLEGEVKSEDWYHLWDGYSPDGQKLVNNAGNERRVAGHDITLSAPKSVSIVFGVGSEDVRERIEHAQAMAAQDAMQYIEDYSAYSRRGYNGEVGEDSAGLFIGSVTHSTNRLNEVQLHTHNLIFNAGVREDGTTGSLNSRHFYQSKMAAGALYRSSLATYLQREGFEIELTDNGRNFELKGLSQEVLDAFSTRSKQIDDYLEENGLDNTAANRSIAATETRQNKEKIPFSQLQIAWIERAAVYGVTPESINALRGEGKELSEIEVRHNQEQALAEGLDKLHEQKAYFSQREYDRALAESSIGKGLTYADIKATKERFFASKDAVEIEGDEKGRLFTTQQQLDREARLYELTMSREQDKSHKVESKHRFQALKDRPTMETDQRIALGHITSPGAVKVLSGLAGTGKSYTLGAVNDVFSKSGFEVQGMALSAKAAEGLQSGSGIQSRSIDSFLLSLDKKRERLAKEGMGDAPLISSNTVLVVDEAAMCDNKRLLRLFEEVDKGGGKLVLVGDDAQLQAVDQGGAFTAIKRQVGDVELTTIRRQEDQWAKEAVRDFEAGRARKALEEYDRRGYLVIEDNIKDLRGRVLDDWELKGGVIAPEKHLILAQKRADVRAMNLLAQQKRKEAGELGNTWSSVGEYRIFEGDRVQFGMNSKEVGVDNGQMGKVLRINNVKRSFDVELDGGKRISFATKDYNSFSLGYASTVHKFQGGTIDHAYLMASSNSDKHLSYVGGSRSKVETKIYAQGDKAERDKVKDDLGEKMSTDNKKQLASDRIPEYRQARDNKMRVGQEI